MNIEELKEIIKNSQSYADVFNRLNKNGSSKAYSTLRRLIVNYGIDCSHFLSRSELIKKYIVEGRIKKHTEEELFCENSKCARGKVKLRILQDKLIPYICAFCGNMGTWQGKNITLILDHINGISRDHRLINLRFLCPNCNATLPTHCIGYKGLIEKPKKIDRRKTRFLGKEWITKDELNNLMNLYSDNKIGKMKGVSATTIKRWAKKYNLEPQSKRIKYIRV